MGPVDNPDLLMGGKWRPTGLKLAEKPFDNPVGCQVLKHQVLKIIIIVYFK